MRLAPGPSFAFVCCLLAVGCAQPSEAPPVVDPTPNWYRDVQPVVSARCATCHAAGGVAPFALGSYDEVMAQLPAVLAATQARRMPPWMPDETGCEPLRDSRHLEQAEIDLLQAWSDAGSKMGEPTETKMSAVASTETLDWVDTTLDQGFDYTPRSDRTDDYRCFMLDPDLGGAKDLIGFEVTPGSRGEVHHVLLFSMGKNEALAQAAKDPSGKSWSCFGGPGSDAPKLVGGWVPGSFATHYPIRTGATLYGGDVLVMQVHYNTTRQAPAPDRTKVALQFARNPVDYRAQMFPLVDHDFRIPPRAMNYSTTVEFEVPVDATVWGGVPHMHTRGSTIKVEKVNVDGSTTCMMNIPKWDFQWQQYYFFQRAQRSHHHRWRTSSSSPARGTNTTDSELRWGESTSDEMCLAYLYITGKVE